MKISSNGTLPFEKYMFLIISILKIRRQKIFFTFFFLPLKKGCRSETLKNFSFLKNEVAVSIALTLKIQRLYQFVE